MLRKTSLLAAAAATVTLTTAASAQVIVYNNTSTTLGAGSLPVFAAGDTTPGTLNQEVGDVVTLDPATTERVLDNIRIGYFTQDIPNDGMDDDRFIADFIFRIYALDGLGEVIDAPIYTFTQEDNLWFDGAFAQTFDLSDDAFVLPESFAYTLAVGDRVDDPVSEGDGLATAFSFNSRGPVDVGSSPEGLLRRNDGTFETVTFASGRETRLTIEATIPEPASLGLLSVAGLGLMRRRR
ncbi:MAG: PEP-CTERM sorting domain-containing protein [Planctomycetota bacterium]